MIKTRYLENIISQLCFSDSKMAFVSGPRQCGKTTMAKHLLQLRGNGQYFNWDETRFRKLWTKDPSFILDEKLTFNNTKPLIILDEIYKAKFWKRNLKGFYDTLKINCDIMVIGSARLNVYRRGSDSLQGRYYHFHLHPFSLAELLHKTPLISQEHLIEKLFSLDAPSKTKKNIEYLDNLMQFGPFPEPFLAADSKKLNLWLKGRNEKIIREELRDLSRLPELSQVEMLVSLLPERASSILSLQSLSEDLEVAYTTVKRWVQYLQELYYIFKIHPYYKSLPRSLKKEAKLYLWDWSEIPNAGARFENLIACHLLKYCDYLTDSGEGDFQLRFIRNKQKKEIDFLILKNNKPWLPIEVKLNDDDLSANWPAFMDNLPCKQGIQLINKENVYRIKKMPFGNILIISASKFLEFLI